MEREHAMHGQHKTFNEGVERSPRDCGVKWRAVYYGQFRIQLRRFQNAEARNKDLEKWNNQTRPQFPPDGFELVTDELLNEWHDLRIQYASEFQNEHIKQLQFIAVPEEHGAMIKSKHLIVDNSGARATCRHAPFHLDCPSPFYINKNAHRFHFAAK